MNKFNLNIALSQLQTRVQWNVLHCIVSFKIAVKIIAQEMFKCSNVVIDCNLLYMYMECSKEIRSTKYIRIIWDIFR